MKKKKKRKDRNLRISDIVAYLFHARPAELQEPPLLK
jgi:hypothetical protein